jgi:2-polyprenyl-3-methyl-5-hydroxy-6-metoxy-1,4-benzoquinol methylase
MPSPLALPVSWDLVADAYADEVMAVFETFAREALRLAAPPPGARVVDVSCGPGTLALVAAAAGYEVEAPSP